MKVAALLSGGKDSIYAIYWALNQAWDVECLISVLPESEESWMFHYPNAWITSLQAKALGIPLIQKKTQGEKEEELVDLLEASRIARDRYGVEGLISGALASEYQRTRIEGIGEELGLKTFTPLWHKNQRQLMQDFINAGFEAIITGVSAYGLEKEMLGREINEELLEDLEGLHGKYKISIAGEGGEYETLVLYGPIFNSRIVLDETEIEWKKDSGILIVKRAHLEPASNK